VRVDGEVRAYDAWGDGVGLEGVMVIWAISRGRVKLEYRRERGGEGAEAHVEMELNAPFCKAFRSPNIECDRIPSTCVWR
jgi:hypothetical protein